MVAEAIRTFPLLKYRFLDISEVAAKIKLTPAPTSSHAEEVLVHLFAQNSLENHFAEPEQRRFATFRRMRIGLIAATAGVLVAGASGAGFNLYQAAAISSEIEGRNIIGRGIENEYRSVSDAMRQQKMASDTVRDTSIFFNTQIKPQPAGPGPLLRDVAGVLSEFPRVRLLQVVWASGSDPAATPYYVPSPAQGNLAIRSEIKATPSAAPAAAIASAVQTIATSAQSLAETNPALPGNKIHVAVVEAAIAPFAGDFRDAILEINKLVDKLNTTPGLKASVITLPIDTSTGATIHAGGAAQQADLGEARFAIKVTRLPS
jgi:hypothetical protein